MSKSSGNAGGLGVEWTLDQEQKAKGGVPLLVELGWGTAVTGWHLPLVPTCAHHPLLRLHVSPC